MSSEKFENLEEDFRNLSDDIQKKIDTRLSKSWGEGKKKLVRDIEKQIETAYSLVRELEGEAQHAPQPFRSHMIGKLRNYNDDIKRFNDKLNIISNNDNHNRHDLLGGPSNIPGLDVIESSHRTRLLQTGDILNRTSESIGRSQHIAAETDVIGNEIVDELGQQREALIRTKDRLSDTDTNLSRSRKILRSMYRRVMTNKLILVVIILVEAGILIGLVYWKFFSH